MKLCAHNFIATVWTGAKCVLTRQEKVQQHMIDSVSVEEPGPDEELIQINISVSL